MPSIAQVIAPLCGFTATLSAFYCGVPFVLRRGGAAVLNLSLLTSDLWAAAAQLAFFGARGIPKIFLQIVYMASPQ